MPTADKIPDCVPYAARGKARDCRFQTQLAIERLEFRESAYFHTLLVGRHIGIHRPDGRICNWTARILTSDKRYVQKCLGPALPLGRGHISYFRAIERAFSWFETPDVKSISHRTRPAERTKELSICPIGETYTVGHALKDYTEWTQIARSPGGHYNNLILMNYHIVPNFSVIPLEEFNARHLVRLARQVLERSPRFGFMGYAPKAEPGELTIDDVRRRKRTFNSLVSIMRMAFQHAWDNGHIHSERPWRCLKRMPINHSPRTIFLTREECRRLLRHCTPALRLLVMAGLCTGCRVGELAKLRVEDVGFQGFGIRVEAFKRSPARFVFLPDEGMAFFLQCCEGKAPRDPVFTSDKGMPWRKQHTGLFRRAVSSADLPKTFVFHGLRHTYASDLVRAGVPLEVVAKQLGHANTMTVSNTYGHLAEHFREDQIRTRFTPLEDAQQNEALRRRAQLDALWKSAQPDDWRDYGALPSVSSHPQRAYVKTHRDVLEVFGRAEKFARS
ncbi:tyrosine-type recombinase/integrase [Rhodobacterales bacterium HKCCE3408]|nr:tyrosine-type recombinase/integrase [Rhodobacterales bacterium HKCCE3408]